ncbi:MAG: tripartite tricarboxylate transporter TctB family protein, partial [Alphaproteobacteria bacterium]
MRFNNAVFGVVLLLFSAAMMAHARTFPEMPGQDYGPALFPVLIGVALSICGILLLFQGIRSRHSAPLAVLGDWAYEPRQRLNFALVVAALIFYITASDYLGFIPTSFLILAILLFRFGASLLTSASVAAAVTLVIHTLFARFLLVPLPWGLLQPIAW